MRPKGKDNDVSHEERCGRTRRTLAGLGPPDVRLRRRVLDAGQRVSSSSDTSGSYDVSSQSITFIPKQLNNPFSDVMLGGGKNAAGEIGFAVLLLAGLLH